MGTISAYATKDPEEKKKSMLFAVYFHAYTRSYAEGVTMSR